MSKCLCVCEGEREGGDKCFLCGWVGGSEGGREGISVCVWKGKGREADALHKSYQFILLFIFILSVIFHAHISSVSFSFSFNCLLTSLILPFFRICTLIFF